MGLDEGRHRGLDVGLEPAADALVRLLHLDLELVVELDGAAGARSARRGSNRGAEAARPAEHRDGTGHGDGVRHGRADGPPGRIRSIDQFAGQLATVTQDAGATASARQTGVSGVAWNGGGSQSNTVASVASATLTGTLAQRIEQRVADADAAQTDQWGGQQAELAQLGDAEATSTQHDAALTGTGVHEVWGLATTDEAAAIAQTLRQDSRSMGGTVSQWAGQLALVEQATNASTTVKQAGSSRSRRTGGMATGSARAAALAVVAQDAEQSTARVAGVGTQTAEQDAFAGQAASARASTDQQAGTAATHDARSGAVALTRAEILQDAVQSAGGSSRVLQDLLQQAIVVQRAEASSLSSGGIAGTAFVLECAVVQQGAKQSIARGPARPGAPADTAFCLPAVAPPTSPPVVLGSPTAPGGELATTAATTAAESVAPTDMLYRPAARASAAASTRARAHHTQRSSSAPSALARARPCPAPPSFRLRPLRKRGSTRARGATREPETPAGSRRSRRRETRPTGSPRSQRRCQEEARRGSQRSSSRSPSRRRSSCGAGRVGRQAAGRRPLAGRRPRLTVSSRHATRRAVPDGRLSIRL